MRVRDRGVLLFVALVTFLACGAPARATSAWDRLQNLIKQSEMEGDDRKKLQDQYRKIQERRKKKTDADRKEALKSSLEAVKEAFEKGKKAYDAQQYSVAYLHFGSVASCELAKAAKMAAEAKTKILEIEGMARAKLDQAELLLLKGDAAEAAKAFLEIVQDFPYGDAATRAKSRLLALRTTPGVAASLRYSEGKAQEDAESYGKALKIYDEVTQRWPQEIAALRARVAAKKIRQNPEKLDLAREALELDAERECPTLLNLARNYLMNEDAATARAKLNQIVHDYPDTSYSEQASAALEAMKGKRLEVAMALLELDDDSETDDAQPTPE